MLILDKDNSPQFTLPEWLILQGNPFNIRHETEKRAFSHGTILTSDAKADEKEITLKGSSEFYNSIEEHNAAVRQLTAFFMRQKQRLVIDNLSYINIDTVAEFNHNYEEGWGRQISNFEIVLLATDPFFYTMSPTIIRKTVDSESTTNWIVSNFGFEVFPVITVTANSPVTSLLIKNILDKNRTMSYADPQFTEGLSVAFDCVKGTVRRQGTNSINNLGGTFLKLLPGENALELSPGKYTIEISYTERWL